MQKILKLFKESKIVKNYTILDFKTSRTTFYYKAKLELINENLIHIKEYISSSEHLYSYHWQSKDGTLITRWDNSPHHKSIKTYPHHKHNPNIEESYLTNLDDLIKFVEKKLLK